MAFDPLTGGQAGALQICTPDREQMNACIFVPVCVFVCFSHVYIRHVEVECEERKLCLQPSFSGCIDGGVE